MADDDFTNNPFKRLDRARFPKRAHADGGIPAAGPEDAARTRRVARHAPAAADLPEDEEASALFLRAMSRATIIPAPAGGRAGLLALGDHLSMDATKKGKRDRGRRKDVAGPPAPSPDPGAEAAADASFHPFQDGDDADAAAFLRAMKEVLPLDGRGRDVAPAVEPPVAPPAGDLGMQDFMEGRLEFALSMTDEYLEGHVVGLDQMIMNKLRSGSLSPEAHLDLHGLNACQAFESLRGFMRNAWYRGLRVILLVPGRGRNSPDGMGVLRAKLQSWLTQDPFKRVVLAFCTARPHDGGAGGVYVLLRKYRKKGRVCWERMPADADLY